MQQGAARIASDGPSDWRSPRTPVSCGAMTRARKPGPGQGVDDGSAPALSLRIPNDVQGLCSALATLDEFMERHRVDGQTAFTVRLAAEEIVTNVIKYAYADTARHEIELGLRLAKGRAVLRVVDDGRAFDPLAAPAPDLTLPVEEKPIGGVGIHLVRTMAELEYTRADGKNVLSATVRIESAP